MNLGLQSLERVDAPGLRCFSLRALKKAARLSAKLRSTEHEVVCALFELSETRHRKLRDVLGLDGLDDRSVSSSSDERHSVSTGQIRVQVTR